MQFPLPPLMEQEHIAVEADRQIRRNAEARESLKSALRRNAQQDNMLLEAAALGGLIEPTGEPPTTLPSEQAAPGQRTLFSESDGGKTKPDTESTDLLSRPIPPGWRWIRVDQAGEVRLGRQRSPEHEYGEHMFPYLRVANVFEDFIDTTDVLEMNITPREQEVYRLVPGDILLNEGQSPELVGRPAMYIGNPKDACFQNTLLRFRHTEYVSPHFALLVFRHYLRSGHFTRVARWSEYRALGSTTLRRNAVPASTSQGTGLDRRRGAYSP
jgi:type I restriction enzyme S subunit